MSSIQFFLVLRSHFVHYFSHQIKGWRICRFQRDKKCVLSWRNYCLFVFNKILVTRSPYAIVHCVTFVRLIVSHHNFGVARSNVIFSSQLVVEKPYQNWVTLTHLDGLQKILKLIDCVLSQSDRGVISDPNISGIFDFVTCDQSCKCRL